MQKPSGLIFPGRAAPRSAAAVKNVVAIACGIVEGRKLGQNARAAVMTRGMAEIRRLGAAKGAHPETFLGLSGLGDLTLTCNSMSSRNFSLGFDIGGGKKAERYPVLAPLGDRGRGDGARRRPAGREGKHRHALSCAVDHILHGGGNVDEIITGLLLRGLKNELRNGFPHRESR